MATTTGAVIEELERLELDHADAAFIVALRNAAPALLRVARAAREWRDAEDAALVPSAKFVDDLEAAGPEGIGLGDPRYAPVLAANAAIDAARDVLRDAVSALDTWQQ